MSYAYKILGWPQLDPTQYRDGTTIGVYRTFLGCFLIDPYRKIYHLSRGNYELLNGNGKKPKKQSRRRK